MSSRYKVCGVFLWHTWTPWCAHINTSTHTTHTDTHTRAHTINRKTQIIFCFSSSLAQFTGLNWIPRNFHLKINKVKVQERFLKIWPNVFVNVKNNDHKARQLLWISVEWARLSNSLCALLQNVCKFLLQIEVNTLSLFVCLVSRRPHWHSLYLHNPDPVGQISLFMLVYYNRSSTICYNKSGFLCLVLKWRVDHCTGFAHNVRPVPKTPQTLYWFLG